MPEEVPDRFLLFSVRSIVNRLKSLPHGFNRLGRLFLDLRRFLFEFLHFVLRLKHCLAQVFLLLQDLSHAGFLCQLLALLLLV